MLVAFIKEVINPNLGKKVIMLHMYLGADTYLQFMLKQVTWVLFKNYNLQPYDY